MTNSTNETIVYSKAVAYELRLLGFKILHVGVNPEFPQYDCYYFESSSKFQEALNTIAQRRREAKRNGYGA